MRPVTSRRAIRWCATFLVALSALAMGACTSGNGSREAPGASTGSSAASVPPTANPDSAVMIYCRTFYGEGEKLRASYQKVDAQSDPVGAFVAAFGAPQEAALFFGKLDKVAPAEIEPSVQILQKTMQSVSDNLAKNAGDPLQAMLQAMMVSAATKGSEDRINAFTLKECGPPPGTEKVATPGQQVLSLTVDHDTNVAMGGSTIAVMGSINGQTELATFGLDGAALATDSDQASYTPGCKMAMTRRSDGVDILLTIQSETTPAQGINPAHTARSLIASDAATLNRLWSVPIDPGSIGDDYCTVNQMDNSSVDLSNTTWFTIDGNWVLLRSLTPSLVINLNTGAPRKMPEATDVAGRYILAAPVGFGETYADKVSVINPVDGSVVGAATGKSAGGDALMYGAGGGNVTQIGVNSFATTYADQTSSIVTQTYVLPSLTPIWSAKWQVASPPLPVTLEPVTGTLIVADIPGVTALSAASGAKRWTANVDGICGVASGKVLVLANNQLAVLDASSGRQLSFDAQISQCPTMLADGYAYTMNQDGTVLVISRVL
jgi:hypothetical protein